MLTDVYSTNKEIIPEYTQGYRKVIHNRYQGKLKLSRVFSASLAADKILQVCHVQGHFLPQELSVEEKGLKIEGILALSVLCLTENEERPYETIKGEVPYSHLVENTELTENSFWKVIPILESLKGTLLDGENLEVKAVIGLEITLGERWQQSVLRGMQMQPLSPEKINSLPGIVVYFADREESLWEVGKRYMIPLESIRTLNQLSSDTLQKGQKLLLVKEVN